MRGVVFKGPRKVGVDSFDDPTPGPGEAVVEIKASGMCGSDLRYYRLGTAAALESFGMKGRRAEDDVIVGHEPCGVVAALGPGIDERALAVGDRVIVYHYDGCGLCRHCRAGWAQMCERGAGLIGATVHGGHADYLKVPASTLMPLPDELSFAAGAAVACGTGTAFGALVRMDLSARDTIAVFGQGPVGQSATQLAAAMGARVIAVDIESERVGRAKEFGAMHAIDSSKADPVEAILELTGGRGTSRSLDCSGAPSARLAAVKCLEPWGKVVFVGEGKDVTLDVSPDVNRKQITIMGSYTFSDVGMANCARFVADHGVDVDKLFTDRWTIDAAEQAYIEFDKQTGGKAVIEF
jgi:threonine dehydrogenase-like Zn-dependent dehydrogenase